MRSLKAASDAEFILASSIRQIVFFSLYDTENEVYAQEIGKENAIPPDKLSFHIGTLEMRGLLARDDPKGTTKILRKTEKGRKTYNELKKVKT
jgi:DNA-binding MarR family transcriptional regulator